MRAHILAAAHYLFKALAEVVGDPLARVGKLLLETHHPQRAERVHNGGAHAAAHPVVPDLLPRPQLVRT